MKTRESSNVAADRRLERGEYARLIGVKTIVPLRWRSAGAESNSRSTPRTSHSSDHLKTATSDERFQRSKRTIPSSPTDGSQNDDPRLGWCRRSQSLKTVSSPREPEMRSVYSLRAVLSVSFVEDAPMSKLLDHRCRRQSLVAVGESLSSRTLG